VGAVWNGRSGKQAVKNHERFVKEFYKEDSEQHWRGLKSGQCFHCDPHAPVDATNQPAQIPWTYEYLAAVRDILFAPLPRACLYVMAARPLLVHRAALPTLRV